MVGIMSSCGSEEWARAWFPSGKENRPRHPGVYLVRVGDGRGKFGPLAWRYFDGVAWFAGLKLAGYPTRPILAVMIGQSKRIDPHGRPDNAFVWPAWCGLIDPETHHVDHS